MIPTSNQTSDPFYDPSAFFRPMLPERLEEIREVRQGWRLNEIGKVDCRRVDPLAVALTECLDEIARVRGIECHP